MKKYLLKVFLFLLPFLIIILVFVFHFGRYIAAPKVTNSNSLNEKINCFKNRKADYVAVGASICLNNLNSAEIVKNIHSESYLNLSAWGLKISDDYKLITGYSKFYVPKVVILVCNVTDFETSGTSFNKNEITNAWSAGFLKTVFYYFKHFDFSYYYSNSNDNCKFKKSNKNYSSLVFDNYGGVPLSDTGFNFEKDRVNINFISPKIDEVNYLSLDSLCTFLKSQNTTLILIYSPLQTSKIVKSSLPLYLNYIKRTGDLIKSNKYYFYDSNTCNWADNLFVDPGHMNTRGAIAFTDSCVKNIILPTLSSIHSN